MTHRWSWHRRTGIVISYGVAAAGAVASLISFARTASGGNYVVFGGAIFAGLTAAKRNWDVLLRLRRHRQM
jgi:hypothetical protein